MTEHKQLFTEVTFDSLGLEPTLLKGVADAGFERCTPIQAQALPMALQGQDVAGQAQTGTGKSAAFLLATMHHLLRHPPTAEHVAGHPRAIILAPTRELAVQIHKDGEVLGRHTGLRLAVVFGGTGYESQRETVRGGVDILIGTPGRLIDYFKQKVFGLNGVQVVVLDEADRMFDLGFIKDIRFLMRRMPPPERRLNMLFSATLSLRVQELAYEHMNAPKTVNTSSEQVTVDKIKHVLYHVASDEKVRLVINLLRRMDPTRTILFTNTKRAAERVAAYLKGNGFSVGMLSGDVPQKSRLSLLERFKSGELAVLVATDVAARGLHIPDVSHVINNHHPQDPEDYVHRVGRTARVGATGDAVTLACEQYVFSLAEIERYIGGKLPVEQVDPALLADVHAPDYSGGERIARRDGGRRGEGGRHGAGARGGGQRSRGANGRRDGRGEGRQEGGAAAEGTHGGAGPAAVSPQPAAVAAAGGEGGARSGQRRRRRRRRTAQTQPTS